MGEPVRLGRGWANLQVPRTSVCGTETVHEQGEPRHLGGAVAPAGIRGTLPTDPLLEGPGTELLSYLRLENRSSRNHGNEIITID